MNLIELHILQSFPVSCLNRDDLGAPKTATFGGVPRSRISSQCLKRAVRLQLNSVLHGDPYHTERTRLAHEALAKLLTGRNKLPKKNAEQIALEALSGLVDGSGAKGAKADKSGRIHLPSLIYLSPKQLKGAATAILANKAPILKAIQELEESEEKPSAETVKTHKAARQALRAALSPVSQGIKRAGLSDAADIALFGRMIANDASLNIEGAAMFSHALSTHRSENDLDFFSAVDDVKAREKQADDIDFEGSGAAWIDSNQFTSATYYRFCALNLDLLSKNFTGLKPDRVRAVTAAFLRSVIEAVPSARQNSMNAHVRPDYVLGVCKSRGQPVQLVNAFENPIRPDGSGFMKSSTEALRSKLSSMKDIWGIKTEIEASIPDDGSIDHFIDTITAHVA